MEPITPPVMAAGLNAPRKIMPNTPGTFLKLTATTPRPSTTYSSAMKGTRRSVTRPMRLMPPSSTRPTRMAISTPMPRLMALIPPSGVRPKLDSAELMEVMMALT